MFIVAGVLLLLVVIILCFSAYAIRAESFEFSAVILRLFTFSIKIISPHSRPEANEAIPQRRTPRHGLPWGLDELSDAASLARGPVTAEGLRSPSDPNWPGREGSAGQTGHT
jgi:hypothetical protein